MSYEKCNCDCHHDKNIRHVMPCCQVCKYCKENIESGYYDSHVEKCKLSVFNIINIIDQIINKTNFQLVASDTHRWVASDSFYEVQFMLEEDPKEKNYNDENHLYITTVSGDQNLEDEWSNNNPQVTSTFELINYIDDEDCSIIYERLLLFIREKDLNIEV